MALYRGVKFHKEVPQKEEDKDEFKAVVPVSRSVLQSFKRIVSKLNPASYP